MEAEAVVNLFDSIWFHLEIFETQPKTSLIPSTSQPSSSHKPSNQKVISTQMSFHQRSKSDELPNFPIEDSSSVKPHPQTIPSDKEMLTSETSKTPTPKIIVSHIERRKKRLSKSLSELEFEEVKGFLDLGFVFSEEDKEDSSLVEIIPGLQKLCKKTDYRDQENINMSMIEEESCGVRARPYLSEAWELSEYREKEEKTVMQWRVPSVRNEMVMKDSLKSWAHTVAFAVR